MTDRNFVAIGLGRSFETFVPVPRFTILLHRLIARLSVRLITLSFERGMIRIVKVQLLAEAATISRPTQVPIRRISVLLIASAIQRFVIVNTKLSVRDT